MAAKPGMTRGVKNALARKDHHSMCGTDGCGFALPKYPGRYPKDCPSCGEPRAKAEAPASAPEESFDLELGGTVHHAEKGRGVIVELDGDTAYAEYPDGSVEEIAQ